MNDLQNDMVVMERAMSIERCFRTIRRFMEDDPDMENLMTQDIVVLNLQRACQAAIQIAKHTMAVLHLGLAQTSSEAFFILHREGLLDATLSRQMQAMVGFRNIAVHVYQELDMTVVREIAMHGGKDFERFCACFGVKIIT